MNSPAPAVDLRGLHKTYRTRGREPVHAVAGIDLRIDAGEVVAVLGPNGAGKTTTLDMLLGLVQPSDGEVGVFGLEPREAIAAGRVSAVLQAGGLLRDLTIRETLRIIASTFERPAQLDAVLERAGLTAIADRRVAKCSGGEQQRLRFALALLPDPDLLVLDEPTAGMDVTARREFWSVMRAEAAQGRTVVFATHYLAEASDFADRIVVVAQGRIVADDTTENIRAHTLGRTVSAVVPEPDGVLAGLDELEAVRSVHRDGDRVVVRAIDSDAVARHLLAIPGAHDLLITSADLEDAFVALTGGEPT